jgi:hypothetical protein
VSDEVPEKQRMILRLREAADMSPDWPVWVDPATGLYHDYAGVFELTRREARAALAAQSGGKIVVLDEVRRRRRRLRGGGRG